ncbi:hypothetical protein C5167_028684 [Papaver somniferum]|nr:hypothetical protein C5167_028684 [Papaver somniferum]
MNEVSQSWSELVVKGLHSSFRIVNMKCSCFFREVVVTIWRLKYMGDDFGCSSDVFELTGGAIAGLRNCDVLDE